MNSTFDRLFYMPPINVNVSQKTKSSISFQPLVPHPRVNVKVPTFDRIFDDKLPTLNRKVRELSIFDKPLQKMTTKKIVRSVAQSAQLYPTSEFNFKLKRKRIKDEIGQLIKDECQKFKKNQTIHKDHDDYFPFQQQFLKEFARNEQHVERSFKIDADRMEFTGNSYVKPCKQK